MSNTISHNGYTGSVQYSTEDEIFYGKILHINDLVTFEADNVADLKKNFIESVEDYIKTCKILEKTPQKTFKGVFNVRVAPELHQKAALSAQQKNISLNKFVEESIQEKVSA